MKQPDPLTARSLSFIGWLAASWLALVLLGYSALRMQGALAAGNPLSVDRSLFASVNVASLTGFAVTFARTSDYADLVQLIFSLQTVVGTLLSLVAGGVLTARLLGLPHSDARIASASIILITGAAVVGVLSIGANGDLGMAAMRGIGALGCSGILFGQMSGASHPATLLAMLPLSVLGSLGVLLVLEVIDRLRYGVPIHAHIRSAAVLVAVVYVAGTLVTWFFLPAPTGSAGFDVPARASAIVLSARGYGLPFEFASGWPRSLAWWIMSIILVGAGTAGTAGGMGLGYLMTFRHRHLHPILVGVGIQLAFILCGLLLLLQTEPQLAADRLALAACSAGMGVGVSFDPLTMSGAGSFVLSGLMLVSRILPLAVLAGMLIKGLGARSVPTLAIVDNPSLAK